MFRCENKGCKEVTLARQPENKVVIETRRKEYENTIKRGKNKGSIKHSSGEEIVKEIRVCPPCYRLLTGEEPRIYRPIVKRVSVKNKYKTNRAQKKWESPKARKSTHKGQKKKKVDKKVPVIEVVNPLPIVKG